MKAEAWRGRSFKGQEHLFWKGTNLELRELSIFQEWPIKMDLVFADGNGTLINLKGIRLRPKSAVSDCKCAISSHQSIAGRR